jgi:hypothetical protein
MTLIITTAAAIAASIVWYATGRSQRVAALALIYWGASLMWCVDGFSNLAHGEAFVELSDGAQMVDDAILGVTVVAVGLAIWGIYLLITRQRRMSASAQ